MTQVGPEYGATRGMYMGWTDSDLAASRKQQASMDAQRRMESNGVSWQGLDTSRRAILARYELGELTEDEAGELLMRLDTDENK